MKLMCNKFNYIVLVCFLISALCCSKKLVKDQAPDNIGGVCISFDDYSIDNWYKYLPLLDQYNAKVTFYVSNFNNLTLSQIEKLRAIQSRGHEIGFHTTTHPNLKALSQKVLMDTLVAREITKGIDQMQSKGFYPQTFAYPYGIHTPTLDATLLNVFKSVRCLNGSSNILKSYGQVNGVNAVTYSVGMDIGSHRALEFFDEHLQNTANFNKVFFMNGHNIEVPNSKIQIPLGKFTSILQLIKKFNLKYYTASQVAGR